MGKCKFNQLWLHHSSFREWVKPVDGDIFATFCSVCKRTFKLGTMGVKALDSHAQSSKHMALLNDKRQTPSVSSVFRPAVDVSQLVPSQLPSTAKDGQSVAATVVPSTRVDLRTTLGSTPTMKAEVLWTLHTVAQHQSYNGNEGVSELFKLMFPDSDIAQSFRCGADKTAYIAKYGLAIHIKDELMSKINQSPFVLMFDESMNVTTKTKQLDVHVRFWSEGQVRSRYFGSQFMGHSTAKDLLSHLKECTDKLDLKNLVSISMDGPSVNWKLKCFFLT
ncbi:uncharacterized protein LOC132870980 [Neoarius graeffei]|uniref:uncharacterized protein LOC132870980 n=1 Tax=Neoarius graeffei TaxID=443677 RepID=UPI00298D3E2A|nr:uncharacterized protein LOC132870980 [Neoarius graeffei]